MTLKAFIPPSFVVHLVRYFRADIGGEPRVLAGVSSSIERRYPFVRSISPLKAAGYYDDATMNATITICDVRPALGKVVKGEDGWVEPPFPWTHTHTRARACAYIYPCDNSRYTHDTHAYVCVHVRTTICALPTKLPPTDA